ncbi:MAG: hypothetical protein ACJ73D_01390 [Pyrinomonadaceae bacterium]
MTKTAATLVQAFTALSPKEQTEVIDLIAEYYLTRPKHRQALLNDAHAETSDAAPKAARSTKAARKQRVKA